MNFLISLILFSFEYASNYNFQLQQLSNYGYKIDPSDKLNFKDSIEFDC